MLLVFEIVFIVPVISWIESIGMVGKVEGGGVGGGGRLGAAGRLKLHSDSKSSAVPLVCDIN